MEDGLEALNIMLRHWSGDNIRVYYWAEDSIALTGAESYTIGPSGNIVTTRPQGVRRAYVEVSPDNEEPIKYRYNGTFPNGTIYVDKYVTGTLYIESLKHFTEPDEITDTISFPPEYDEAIKYNLAVRLAPEYGREPSQVVVALAQSSLNTLETKNFSNQIEIVKPEILYLARGYNIDAG